ncbi:MAG: hypothetical protein M1825_005929 [Sarcosagium campestre]|nr:MAG: hypothetical protein M1825_005929 [Sarcosagium campestre]
MSQDGLQGAPVPASSNAATVTTATAFPISAATTMAAATAAAPPSAPNPTQPDVLKQLRNADDGTVHQLPSEGPRPIFDRQAPSAGGSQEGLVSLDLLLSQIRGRNTTVPAHAAASEQAAQGETSRHARSSARRTAALRHLNAVPSSRHRPPPSVGSRGTASSLPVVVHAYSKATNSDVGRAPSVAPDPDTMDRAELPPIDAFTFDGIMKAIDPEISGTLDAIAGICANSRYSLSNQYEVHMAPHGVSNMVASSPAGGMDSGDTLIHHGHDRLPTPSTLDVDQAIDITHHAGQTGHLEHAALSAAHKGGRRTRHSSRDASVAGARSHLRYQTLEENVVGETEETPKPKSPLTLFSGSTLSRPDKSSAASRGEMSRAAGDLASASAKRTISKTNVAVSSTSRSKNASSAAAIPAVGSRVDELHPRQSWTTDLGQQASVLDNIATWLSGSESAQASLLSHGQEVRIVDPTAEDSLRSLLHHTT